jgi:hypothetical protein
MCAVQSARKRRTCAAKDYSQSVLGRFRSKSSAAHSGWHRASPWNVRSAQQCASVQVWGRSVNRHVVVCTPGPDSTPIVLVSGTLRQSLKVKPVTRQGHLKDTRGNRRRRPGRPGGLSPVRGSYSSEPGAEGAAARAGPGLRPRLRLRPRLPVPGRRGLCLAGQGNGEVQQSPGVSPGAALPPVA